MATVQRIQPRQQATDLGTQRATALQTVFPSTVGPSTPVGPVAGPMPLNPATRTRAQAPVQRSAGAIASEAVAAARRAAPSVPVPVKRTRANTPLAQSAGTINTNYIKSAEAQGYYGVPDLDLFKGMRDSRVPDRIALGGSSFAARLAQGGSLGGRDPSRTLESFRNTVFTPPPSKAIFASPQQQAFLYSNPLPQASGILQQPAVAQVGQPVPGFPPRQPLLNYLFPR